MAKSGGERGVAAFEFAPSAKGVPAGKGRSYVAVVGREGDAGFEATYAFDLTAPGNASEVADAVELNGIGANPDMEDDAMVVEHLALREAAVSVVEYEAFASDGAYLEAFDKARDSFHVREIRRDGTRVRYAVGMAYGGPEEGDWSDHVMATDEEDAEFQARWTCAENAGAKPSDGMASMVSCMVARTIECRVEPTTARELADAVMGLASRHVAGEDLDGALREVVAMAANCTDARPSAPTA